MTPILFYFLIISLISLYIGYYGLSEFTFILISWIVFMHLVWGGPVEMISWLVGALMAAAVWAGAPL